MQLYLTLDSIMPSPDNQLATLRQPLRITANLRGHPLAFNTTWGVFSPRDIDEGSRLLLEYVDITPQADCFDLGCGYGALGITLAKMAPKGQTLMVDKDFVAVNLANENALVNHAPNAKALLSNGFDQVEQQMFDCIVSNIPAKVGNEMLTLFMHDAAYHLKSGGRFYVVTINGLRHFIKRSFNDVFGNYKKHKQGKNYTVASAEKILES